MVGNDAQTLKVNMDILDKMKLTFGRNCKDARA